MSKKQKKRAFGIRAKLFFSVGAIFLLAVVALVGLNRWYLPSIYIFNEKKDLKAVSQRVDEMDYQDENYGKKLHALEKQYSITIDVYSKDGTPLYIGEMDVENLGGKVEIAKRDENADGSFFEIQNNVKTGLQYIVYGKSLSFGGEIEVYAQKNTIDSYADTASNVMMVTSVVALLSAFVVIYLYANKFTKPLIQMNEVTGGMAEMDFSKKCAVKSQDEIGNLSKSINHLSDTLNVTLLDLQEKNEKLQLDIEREKELDKIRKDFISNVSHELKTPIAIIRGYAEGAKLMLDSKDMDGAGQYCDIIADETEKMNTLVLQLLELSRLESGNVEVHKAEIDLRQAVQDYAEENALLFAQKKIRFENQIREDILGVGDIIKIQMIINNYISNACSHVSGDMKIIASSEESPENANSWRISVFNTGNHIAPEDIQKIWISFYRADKAHSRDAGRFGLGLSIVSAIQKLHGQSYGVENVENGVRFWFDIQKG